jgi:hypothetical protein
LLIQNISIQTDLEDYTTNLKVFPGSEGILKVEGTGLSKAKWRIEELTALKKDSVKSDDNTQYFSYKVPLGISKKRLNLLVNEKSTGYSLTIKEYQEPQKLDFIVLSLDGKQYPVQSSSAQILFEETLKEPTISFLSDRIDEKTKLYGKQYITIQVSLFNNKQQLLESRTIENVVVCPGENSVRALFYPNKDCNKNPINLNNILSRKTFNLEDWSSMELTFKQVQQEYSLPVYNKKITVIFKRKYNFDLDVSFPGGLLIKRVGDPKFDPFSGVSLAVLGQFKFYKPDKIEQLYPFRLGVGFLALNAFNFSNNNVNRDLGIVALGSVFPINTGQKLSFPVHAGFGYFTNADKWFYVLGPGIQVRF